jgi:hypothetical protein
MHALTPCGFNTPHPRPQTRGKVRRRHRFTAFDGTRMLHREIFEPSIPPALADGSKIHSPNGPDSPASCPAYPRALSVPDNECSDTYFSIEMPCPDQTDARRAGHPSVKRLRGAFPCAAQGYPQPSFPSFRAGRASPLPCALPPPFSPKGKVAAAARLLPSNPNKQGENSHVRLYHSQHLRRLPCSL